MTSRKSTYKEPRKAQPTGRHREPASKGGPCLDMCLLVDEVGGWDVHASRHTTTGLQYALSLYFASVRKPALSLAVFALDTDGQVHEVIPLQQLQSLLDVQRELAKIGARAMQQQIVQGAAGLHEAYMQGQQPGIDGAVAVLAARGLPTGHLLVATTNARAATIVPQLRTAYPYNQNLQVLVLSGPSSVAHIEVGEEEQNGPVHVKVTAVYDAQEVTEVLVDCLPQDANTKTCVENMTVVIPDSSLAPLSFHVSCLYHPWVARRFSGWDTQTEGLLCGSSSLQLVAVEFVPATGLCLSMMNGTPYRVVASECPPHATAADKQVQLDNTMHVAALAKYLAAHTSYLVVQSQGSDCSLRGLYVLMPSNDKACFLLQRLATWEFVRPPPSYQHMDSYVAPEAYLQLAAALDRVRVDEYNPLAHTSGLYPALAAAPPTAPGPTARKTATAASCMQASPYTNAPRTKHGRTEGGQGQAECFDDVEDDDDGFFALPTPSSRTMHTPQRNKASTPAPQATAPVTQARPSGSRHLLKNFARVTLDRP